MKSTYTPLLFLTLLICLFSCQRKHYSFQDLPEEYVVFGNGGGFAGAVHEYYLFPDGQLIELKSLQQDTVHYAVLKRKTARNLIDSCMLLPLDKLAINEPGNTYSFIRQVKNDSLHSATWGNHQYTPPADISNMYKRLTQFLIKEEVE